MSQTLTITLPDSVFQKLTRVAELTYRTVDEIVASTVETTLVSEPDLPGDLAAELVAMQLFSDDGLWAATQPTLSTYEQHRLAQLSDFADERHLTKSEEAEQTDLLYAYDRSVLRRAQALALLKQRGHDLTPALSLPVAD
jgi:hypothetical protein